VGPPDSYSIWFCPSGHSSATTYCLLVDSYDCCFAFASKFRELQNSLFLRLYYHIDSLEETHLHGAPVGHTQTVASDVLCTGQICGALIASRMNSGDKKWVDLL